MEENSKDKNIHIIKKLNSPNIHNEIDTAKDDIEKFLST